MPYSSGQETQEEFNTRLFLSKTHQEGDHLLWDGYLSPGGYPLGYVYYRRVFVHRWLYEQQVGPIPEDHDLDHVCGNRRCLNMNHLEPVTRAENLRRARERKYNKIGGE